MAEQKESKIFLPQEETPELKQKAKEEEEVARRRSSMRKAAVEEAGKIIKQPRGIREGEFKDKWLGRRGKESIQDLADWVFTELFIIASYGVKNVDDLEDLRKEGLGRGAHQDVHKKWKEVVEPALRNLAAQVFETGAQEHILNYLADEWQPGHNEEEKAGIRGAWEKGGTKDMEDMKNVIWQIWQKCLEEASGGPV